MAYFFNTVKVERCFINAPCFQMCAFTDSTASPAAGRLVCHTAHQWRALFCHGDCAVRKTSGVSIALAPWTEGMSLRKPLRIYKHPFEWSHTLFVVCTQMSVMHLLVRRHPSNTEPIKSKEELVFHCGFRRFKASPIFSQHTTGWTLVYPANNDCNSDQCILNEHIYFARHSQK